MVVGSVYWIYGFQLNETMLDVLQKSGVITSENKLFTDSTCYRMLCIIQTPHVVRWTDYPGNTYYFGLCQEVQFQSYEAPPLKKYNDDFIHIPLNKLFKLPDANEYNEKSLQLLLGTDIECTYEMIPTDCNCCS